MPSDASATQDKLLDAATALFAERGIADVSLAEIVRAAGQRNASAVHYHFGGRDQVLEAILARHVPQIRSRRRELLAIAESKPGDVRSAAEALVRPVTELAQRGWRERAYLQIGAELTSQLDRSTSEMRRLFRETAGPEVFALMAERCAEVPPEIWRVRALLGNAFVGRASADRARTVDQGDGSDRLADDEWVSNLVDMFIGMMTAPVTS